MLEAAAPRAAAGAMATAAAMQDAISTELTGAETIGECEVVVRRGREWRKTHILRLAPEFVASQN